MAGAVERKYQLIKIEAGDYLLPGNDGETLWRVVKSEDGPSYGLDPEQFPNDFTIWLTYRWEGRRPPGTEDDLMLGDGRWVDCASSETRAAAIQYALRSELPKPTPPKPKRSLDEVLRSLADPTGGEDR